jgi:hypothetical protein
MHPPTETEDAMITTAELAQAKEAVSTLLEQLGVAAYLFEIEPREDRWSLRIDCALDEGWQSVALPVDKSLLVASRNDVLVRERLLNEWRPQLGACKTER